MTKKESKPYQIKVDRIQNTNQFRPAALHFTQYGYYCAAPKGTTAYFEYWDRETERCLTGFTSPEGNYITGYNYFYLNYCLIVRVVDNEHTGKREKKKGFPKYWDYDRQFFLAVEEAKNRGNHLAVLKARRKGYSYKIASMLIRNFYFKKDSRGLAYAAENEFLVKDGILTKAWEYLDFIDENTAWYKKRQKTDTKMHKRASFVYDKEGVKTEGGYKSEIMGVTLKNDVDKVRGKSGELIIFEEAGKLPDLLSAWQIARPSVEQGSDVFGQMIVFGTGGSDDSDFGGLRTIFYEPDAYNCLPIENIWDEGNSQPCGFFVPDYYNFGEDFMDEDGNSDIKKALKYGIEQREKIIKASSDRNAIDRYIAEHCFTPEEASLELSTNIFPKTELTKQLAYIRNNQKILDFKQVGNLVFDKDGILVWEPAKVPKDLTKYKVDAGQDTSGQIVIWEHPVDNPPYGLYISGLDPYDHDKSGTNSLGSFFMYKRFQGFESTYDTIVAEYTGRPDTAEEYYENVRKLLLYYNAKCLYENEKKGIFQYFTTKHSAHLLADQPDIIKDIIQDSKVNRNKGIHMVQGIKDWGEGRIRDWLLIDRGNGILNLHTIMSEPLLEELIRYNDKGNFDRYMAFMCVIIYNEEMHNVHIKSNQEDKPKMKLFEDIIFSNELFNIA
jgi:hypothetical protein